MDNVALRFKSKPALQCCFGGCFGLCHWSHAGCAECWGCFQRTVLKWWALDASFSISFCLKLWGCMNSCAHSKVKETLEKKVLKEAGEKGGFLLTLRRTSKSYGGFGWSSSVSTRMCFEVHFSQINQKTLRWNYFMMVFIFTSGEVIKLFAIQCCV